MSMSSSVLTTQEPEITVTDHLIRCLEGKILTIADATTGDATQRKAIKDLLKRELWDWFEELPREEVQLKVTS